MRQTQQNSLTELKRAGVNARRVRSATGCGWDWLRGQDLNL
jgi:hypothetical protein